MLMLNEKIKKNNENQIICWICYANTKRRCNDCHHIKENEKCDNVISLVDYQAKRNLFVKAKDQLNKFNKFKKMAPVLEL
jgi:predicted amidophosphoribosyltransferase